MNGLLQSMATRFTWVKIQKISGCGQRPPTGARATMVSRKCCDELNVGCTSMVVTTVNQYACETGSVCEEVRFESDVIRLWDS
jgi:hypothetical protein